jgi:hypothetical protein
MAPSKSGLDPSSLPPGPILKAAEHQDTGSKAAAISAALLLGIQIRKKGNELPRGTRVDGLAIYILWIIYLFWRKVFWGIDAF